MRNTQFTNEEVYHVYNRGVDKRDIFITENDYLRFLNSIRLFRNTDTNNNNILLRKNIIPDKLIASYVEILAFCLMPNHFHIMLKQKVDDGISTFMHKLGTGYTKYFNTKYERTGSLFESSYKTKHASNEEYYVYLSKYIHTNPTSLKPNLSEKETQIFLTNYKWSSLCNYANNTPDFISLEILNLFKNSEDYLKYLFENPIVQSLALQS